jgi:hypothetical protein
MMTDGFLNRWSQRKQDVREGKAPAEPVVVPLAPLAVAPTSLPADTTADVVPVQPHATPELPTLADAQQLTPASDFKPFMVRGVAADVKNAAMKKLFADPHFNVMDRLDTYIDDYSISDPIPEAMLRKMVSAKFLNLFDEEKEPEAKPAGDLAALSRDVLRDVPRDVPDTPAPEAAAQSPLKLEAPEPHDHPDLRLQPDHAPERESVGRGAG